MVTMPTTYDWDEIVAEYERVGVAGPVAVRFGCSERTVGRIVSRVRGQRLRPVPLGLALHAEFIEYLLDDGAPYTEVARTIADLTGEHVTATMIAHRWPGKGILDASERLLMARAIRDFERLVRRLGLDKEESAAA